MLSAGHLLVMKGPKTYTLRQLVELSGFDKRTIAYYIQEKLLTGAGRRGPRTRYSQEFLDRLMLIRRVRDLQDAGQLRAVTLREIRAVLDDQLPEQTRIVSQESVPAESLRELFAEPDLDTSRYAVAAEDIVSRSLRPSQIDHSALDESEEVHSSLRGSLGSRRMAMASRVAPVGASPSSAQAEASHSARPRDGESKTPGSSYEGERTESARRLHRLLQELDRRTRLGAKRSLGQTRERVTRVPVTEGIILSVRDIDDDDAHLVEELAELLRREGELE